MTKRREKTTRRSGIGSLAIVAGFACAFLAGTPVLAPDALRAGFQLRAQSSTGGVPVNTEVQIRSLAQGVAQVWQTGEMARMEEMLHPSGVEFHAGGVDQMSLEPRRAVAALEDLAERRRSVGVRVEQTRPVAGSTDRGSAELTWQAVAPGTSEVLQQTVFIGFLFDEARWWISEIRILP